MHISIITIFTVAILAQDLQVQQKTKILMVTSVAEIDAHKVLEKLMRELDISQLENTEAQSSEAQSSNIYLVPIVDWETIVMWDEIMWNEMDEIHSPILSFIPIPFQSTNKDKIPDCTDIVLPIWTVEKLCLFPSPSEVPQPWQLSNLQ